ncbi:CPBP family intramembrane metalloprotease [Escherichia coli]|nr:CPBP family intramembrane metalloprotease [Escherichia coli]
MGSCAAPSAKGDDKFITTDYLQQCLMLNVFRSRYCWTMWLGALITSLLFVAAHSQYQNLLTLAELFLVGLITSVARIRSGGLLLPVLLHMEATTLGLLFG